MPVTQDTRKILPFVRHNAFIAGGNYRIDLGPGDTQVKTFRMATNLYRACLDEGIVAKLGCIVNDLGVPPEKRPKFPGNTLFFPRPYREELDLAGLKFADVEIFYESTLVNKARKDANKGAEIALSANGNVVCYAIMGKFYDLLAKSGYSQAVHFYTLNVNNPGWDGRSDKACAHGPSDALLGFSGYELRIYVSNYFVDYDGLLYPDGDFEPKKK